MTPPRHPGDPYFADVADRLGKEYLRYSFTKGTESEVPFLIRALGLRPGQRVLDVGCGPGRHSVALAQAGMAVTGVDVSSKFLQIAAEAARAAGVGASFFEMDARRMPFENEFDAVISICQGGFGLMGDDDGLVLHRMAQALSPGGHLALTAFSALFEASHQREEASFDVDAGVVHEVMTIQEEAGGTSRAEAWTSVYTPRELRLLAIGVGLIPEYVWGVEPGDFDARPPDLERPEFMLVAVKPETAR